MKLKKEMILITQGRTVRSQDKMEKL